MRKVAMLALTGVRSSTGAKLIPQFSLDQITIVTDHEVMCIISYTVLFRCINTHNVSLRIADFRTTL